jgi:ATP-dependent helicase YprA (DUF1998 family)
LRVVIATDVLSEGQNLQDGAIVVNYDLPWAIIRLAQRAGRVDARWAPLLLGAALVAGLTVAELGEPGYAVMQPTPARAAP